MLLREQAITVLKNYTTEDSKFIFPYSFPYHLIPQDLDMAEWELNGEIEIRDYTLKLIVKYAVENFFPKSLVINQSEKETIFVDDLIDYRKIINDLLLAQEEFDKTSDDEKDIATYVNQMSYIKELELVIIDKAEVLLELKEIIETKIIEYGNQIKDKNNW
jgi:hypothetical protein